MTTHTQRFFDGRSADYYETNYVRPRDRHAFNLALRREVCVAMLAEVEGTVLDLGCGPGAMTVPLVQQRKDVVSVDISIAMAIETARRTRDLAATPKVAAADAMALPFKDDAFSAVVTTGVLEYVPDLNMSLREIRRVLRPGGMLVATMSLPRRFERLVTRAFARLRGRDVVQQFILGRREFDAAIEEGGFRIHARRCCTFAPFPLDAVWPRSVEWLDSRFGESLNQIEFACDYAKTYVVRAYRE